VATPTEVAHDAAPAPAPPGPPRRRHTALVAAVAIGAVAVLLFAALATSDPSSTRTADSPLLGRPAPALAGPSLLAGGGDFALDDGAGAWTVVNFFATWCVPCRAEHPELVRFSEAHAGQGDARVVSVVFSDDPDDVARFFAEEGGDWPVLDDAVGRLALEWGVTGVPESFLVAPDGTVVAKVTGGVSAEGLEGILAQARGDAPAGQG